MKRIVSLLLVSILLLPSAIFAKELKNGDVVNKTVYTDIIAKINGYDIASYNMNGNTVIVAEDLDKYGFDVTWDGENRTLHIVKDEKEIKVKSKYEASSISKSDIGKKANDVLHTDIKTYMDGVLTESYNIGGRTVIYFNELKKYGKVSYDNDKRVISAKLAWTSVNAEGKKDAYANLKKEIKERGQYDDKLGVYDFIIKNEETNLRVEFRYVSGKGDIVIKLFLDADKSDNTTIYIKKDGVFDVVKHYIGSNEYIYEADGDGYLQYFSSAETAISDNTSSWIRREVQDLKERGVEINKRTVETVFKLIDIYLSRIDIDFAMSDLGLKYGI